MDLDSGLVVSEAQPPLGRNAMDRARGCVLVGIVDADRGMGGRAQERRSQRVPVGERSRARRQRLALGVEDQSEGIVVLVPAPPGWAASKRRRIPSGWSVQAVRMLTWGQPAYVPLALERLAAMENHRVRLS